MSLETSLNLIDPSYELIDPTPDIFALFIQFNDQFFYNQLGACTVEWSKKMTSCAGVCSFHFNTGLCSIRLSEPLLKLRPRKDLIETLLHEMIHAYLFITSRLRDREGHGPEFQAHMHRINQMARTNITIYHSFHAEVAVYKQHWWRCNGECQHRGPFYGWVKRAMNRAPSRNDFWWEQHQQTCNGTFIKVKEPENLIKQTTKTLKTNSLKSKIKETKQINDGNNKRKTIKQNDEEKENIKKYFTGTGSVLGSLKREETVMKQTKDNLTAGSFPGNGKLLGSLKREEKKLTKGVWNKLGSAANPFIIN